MNKITILAILVLFVISILVFMKEDGGGVDKKLSLKEGSVILAFGDSLTYGFGVKRELSYPSIIQSRTSFKVINAGVNGEVSAEGLKRLPLFLEKKPDLVILCHGGNDIIRNLPAKELKQNLLTMIQRIEQSGAEILFVGVPNFDLFGFDTHEVYEEIAEETGVVFESKVLTTISKDRSLKSDYVHPNEKGYEKMAEAFMQYLR